MNEPAWSELVLEGFFAPEDAGNYHNVPFDMPAGIGRLSVSYQYDTQIAADIHLTGGNTLDIGIFDQRGADFLGEGFRGWSGSDRDQFFVGFDEATPGYIPGPLEAGRWHICLGFYKSAPDGCHYQVTLRFWFSDEDLVSPDFPPMLTIENSRSTLPTRVDGWYRGELHCHSQHSDGDSTPADLISTAHQFCLDFIAITDHNSLSHLVAQAKLEPPPIVLIPGCEVTAYSGHWNVWGADSWIDFRVLSPDQMRLAIHRAVELGYLTSCNHPRTGGPPWLFTEITGQHCIEVWNGPWQIFNQESLDYWESRLQGGERLVAVGGSDTHFLKKPHIAQLGMPTNWIYCPEPPTAASLLAGLRAGHVFVNDAPDGPQLYLQCGVAIMGDAVSRPSTESLAIQVRTVNSAGLRLEIHGATGLLAATEILSDEATIDMEIAVDNTPYFRAQLLEKDGNPDIIKALSNPIYIE